MNSEPWSFNQPVLLNKTRRNSSVLVWTLVGTTVFATGWAFLAPLPETVAVQGKLQPSSPVRDIEAPLPGVVECWSRSTVRSGDAPAFDPRRSISAEAATSTARACATNWRSTRCCWGTTHDALTANQQALLRSSSRTRTTDQRRRIPETKVRLEGYPIASDRHHDR